MVLHLGIACLEDLQYMKLLFTNLYILYCYLIVQNKITSIVIFFYHSVL